MPDDEQVQRRSRVQAGPGFCKAGTRLSLIMFADDEQDGKRPSATPSQGW